MNGIVNAHPVKTGHCTANQKYVSSNNDNDNDNEFIMIKLKNECTQCDIVVRNINMAKILVYKHD